MSSYKADNSGGYGNPPINHQFKKKNPGGPGRPRGSTSMDAALGKVFGGKVPYKENGKPVLGPATEALSKRVLQHGLAGPHRATLAVAELARKYGPQEPETNGTPVPFLQELSEEEFRMLGRLMAKATGDQAWDPPRTDPLASYNDPDNPHNYITELTVDGLHYRRCHIDTVADELIEIHSRAYFSAALPRRPGCYRRSGN
jgi:hypothetical protein